MPWPEVCSEDNQLTHPCRREPSSLLSGEEMTAHDELFCPDRAAAQCPIVSFLPFLYAVVRAFEKVAVLTRLFAMTPNPTHRFMPSSPW